MDLNPSDRLALRAALEKLSASEAALTSARETLNDLASKLEPHQPSLVDAPTPAPQLATASTSPGSPTQTQQEGWRAESAVADVEKQAPRVPAYPRPTRPPRPAKPPMSSEEKIMRGVAIGGGIITVAGIILLVSVAIQRGWLGPLGRVIGAYLLTLAFIVAAHFVRKQRTRAAAVVALTVTSQLAFLATTYALIFVLEWWPAPVGALVVFAGNIAYLSIGRSWSKATAEGARTEGHSVFIGAILVSGISALLFSSMNSPAAMWPIFSAIAALIISWRVSTDALRATIATVAIITQFALLFGWFSDTWPAVIAGTVGAALLAAFTLWDTPKSASAMATSSREQVAAEEYWRGFEQNSVSTWLVSVAPAIMVVITTIMLGLMNLNWLALIPAIIIAVVGILRLFSTEPSDGEAHRLARLTSVAGLALIAETFVQTFYDQRPTNPLFVMVFLIVGAGLFIWLKSLPQNRQLGVIPWVAWLIAAVAITGVLLRNVVTLAPLWLTDTSALIQALLIVVFIVATIQVRRIFYGRELWLQILVGLALLTLSAISIVTFTTFLGHLIAGNTGMMLGFLIGHAAVSILWMLLAAVLMLKRNFLGSSGALWTGLGLAAAGSFKLVFFDLVALSGVPRAFAFLLSGIALLCIAALRGRRTAQNRNEKQDRSTVLDPMGSGQK